MTAVAAAVAAAAEALRAAGLARADAERDAAVLARGVLGWSLADWLGRRHTDASPAFLSAFHALIDRRRKHEPVAYLLGVREFHGRPFLVGPGVLVPRPETEGLVEAARQWLTGPGRVSVVDVGTGSGCIAITLALEVPACRVIAIDTSSVALDVARRNAAALGACGIEWRLGDLLAGVPGPVDLVVSNPPYIPECDRASLTPDVRDHEPTTALFAGADGLDVIRRLIPEAARVLRPGGALLMEIGFGQADAVTRLLCDAGFGAPQCHPDLQGIPRVIAAERSARA